MCFFSTPCRSVRRWVRETACWGATFLCITFPNLSDTKMGCRRLQLYYESCNKFLDLMVISQTPMQWYNNILFYQIAFFFLFFPPLCWFLTLAIFYLLKASTNRSASTCNQSASKWVISLESLSSYTNKYYHLLKTPSTVSINKWYKSPPENCLLKQSMKQ